MMSNILNKTFSLAVSSLTTKSDDSIDTNAFIQAIECVENKPEHIIKFLNHLKRSFISLSYSQQYKYMTVLIYCIHLANENDAIKESLSDLGGIITSFIGQAKDVGRKKLGYIALTALVNLGNSEIVYLAVNTLLKDITSNNKGFIIVSLDAVCQLVTTDLVPVLLPPIEKKLNYKDTAVRMRAFRALGCIYNVGAEFVNNTKQHVKLALSDSSPEVMASSLPHLFNVVKNDSSNYEDLPSVLVSILKQIMKGVFPIHMSIHGTSAPFVQVYILKILRLLTLHQETKEVLADNLLDMMNRCKSLKHTIAYGILADCIDLSLRFYHDNKVIFDVAVENLATFLNSAEANYLFTGISLLTQVAKINPLVCKKYQPKFIDCLSHCDLTMRKQTLKLLQVLINKENCKLLCKHMLSMINTFDDKDFTRSFSENLAKIAVKYSSDMSWLLQTLHSLMEKSDDDVPSTVAERLLDQVSKADSSQLEVELTECLNMLDKQLTFHHFEAIIFILSMHLKEVKLPIDKVINLVTKQSKQQLADCKVSRKPEVVFILISFAKYAVCELCSDDALKEVTNVASAFTRNYPAVQQSLYEMEVLSKHPELSEMMLDADVEFDDDSFLSQYGTAAELDQGDEDGKGQFEVSLKVRPYSMQSQPVIKTSTALMASIFMKSSPHNLGESFLSKKQSDEELSVWGQDGYQRAQPTTNKNVDDEALQNESTVDVSDRLLADMVKDAFSFTPLPDSSGSIDGSDHT